MRYKDITTLHEGVKIGKSQIDSILTKHSQNFRIGIEYEVILPDSLRKSEDVIADAKEYSKSAGINHIHRIVPEHDGMVEFITSVMPLTTGLLHIKDFLTKARQHGIKFPSTAGLHVSISHVNGTNKDINFAKFIVLLAADHLHGIFPERTHVSNINNKIRDAIETYVIENVGFSTTGMSVSDIEDVIQRVSFSEEPSISKYITAKVSDFFEQHGRVELRFFGGENYWQQFKDIVWNILRSCYILEIAYGEMYRKEYLKKLYELLPDKDELKVGAFLHYDYPYSKLTDKQKEIALERAKRSPLDAYHYSYTLDERAPELEDVIFKHPKLGIKYALEYDVRSEKIEKTVIDHIATSGFTGSLFKMNVINYASEIMKERWTALEQYITEPNDISKYTKNVLDVYYPNDNLRITSFENAISAIFKQTPASKLSKLKKSALFNSIEDYVKYAYPENSDDIMEKLSNDIIPW